MFCFVFALKTVHYTGDPPTFEEIKEMSNEERKEVVRPLICPCSQGSIGRLCPGIVYDLTNEFRHRFLCASYVPEIEEE